MKKFIPMAIKHKISGVKNEIYSKKIYLKRKITRKFGHSLSREMSDYLREIDEKGFVTIKRPEFISIANFLNPVVSSSKCNIGLIRLKYRFPISLEVK